MEYRLFGVELSPYSVKLRAFLRYKNIPHQWIVRDNSQQAEFKKYAKLPLIPLLVSSEGVGFQDSTPIIFKLDQEYLEPSITPEGDIAPFVSLLLEEYADEWLNKPMFHYRWHYPDDQKNASQYIAKLQIPKTFLARLPIVHFLIKNKIAKIVRQRMIPRLLFVGSNPDTKDQIEGSFHNLCALLDKHLDNRDFVFGGRPALADFALWGQLYNLCIDPTPKKIIQAKYKKLEKWIKAMIYPQATGDWEAWEMLAPTLKPIIISQVATLFLPWTFANAQALAKQEKQFSVQLDGKHFTQETQKYHARSLDMLLKRYRQHKNPALDQFLQETRCFEWLVR